MQLLTCACPMTEHRSANVPFVNGTCTRHGCKGCCTSDLSMPLGDESNAAADLCLSHDRASISQCPIRQRDLYEAWLQGVLHL